MGAAHRSSVGRSAAPLSAVPDVSRPLPEVGARGGLGPNPRRSLVAAAKRAAHDELRHARIMRAFAARFGGTPCRPRVERGPIRSLEEMAIENAAEGCLRETFGALVGMWQARFAGDPQVRRAMRAVARDESQHAALSWEVARWIEPRLGTDARARLAGAKADAIRQLEAELRRLRISKRRRFARSTGWKTSSRRTVLRSGSRRVRVVRRGTRCGTRVSYEALQSAPVRACHRSG
jgi:hypothetical protein